MQIIPDTSTLSPRPCVAAIGFFDGVHTGHRYLIRQVQEVAAARGLCAALLTFPVHPRKVMNPDAKFSLLTVPQEKIALLAETGIDYCLLLDFTPEIARLTARQFMQQVLQARYQVQCLVIGHDHRFGHNRSEVFEDYVRYGRELGMEVIRAQAYASPLTGEEEDTPVSSSLVREQLLRGEVEIASRYLGYEYFIEGTVEGGYRIGRTLGFPTANLRIDAADKLLPADGVYAVWATWKGQRYMGMLNIGFRPTMNNGTHRTIEVNILHFNADLYDQPLRLTFVRRIRPEQKFDSIEALIERMHQDAVETEAILQPRI